MRGHMRSFLRFLPQSICVCMFVRTYVHVNVNDNDYLAICIFFYQYNAPNVCEEGRRHNEQRTPWAAGRTSDGKVMC